MHFYSSWRVQLTVINTRAFEPYSVSSCSMDTFVQRGMSRNTQSHCFVEVNSSEHSWHSQVMRRKTELKRNLILLFTCSWGLQNILLTYKISWLIAGSSDIGFHLCELFVHCRHRDTPLRQKCSDLFPFAETSVKTFMWEHLGFFSGSLPLKHQLSAPHFAHLAMAILPDLGMMEDLAKL